MIEGVLRKLVIAVRWWWWWGKKTSLQLVEMFCLTMCLHLETSALSKVAVNSEEAVVGQHRQSSSPLSVRFYEAWEPWSIKAIVALMSGSQMLFTGLLCSTLHSGRKEAFCSVCSVHVITSCIQPPLKKKARCIKCVHAIRKSVAGCSSNKSQFCDCF